MYELLIAQSMTMLAAHAVVKYSLTIGVYLGAMGIGSLFYSRIYQREEKWNFLFKVEILLSIFGALSVIFTHLAHIFFGYLHLAGFYYQGVILFFLLVSTIVLIIGFLTGLELPLLINIGYELKMKGVANRLLAFDYIGALFAGIMFPLFLVLHFKIVGISLIVALLNLLVALVIIIGIFKRQKLFRLKLILVIIIFLLLLTGIINTGWIEQYFLKRYYYYDSLNFPKDILNSLNDFPNVLRINSPYQKIDVVQSMAKENDFSCLLVDAYTKKYIKDPDCPRDYYLFLNGDYQFSADIEEIYHEYFAHIPIVLSGKVPQKVLILGAGDGLLTRELLKYSAIQSIDQVDIDQQMINLAKTHPVLTYLNKHSLSNPKVSVIIDDGYQYIKNTKKKYDAVYIDFPAPVDYNLSKLYSREFYSFVGKCLKDNGYIALDAPGIDVVGSHGLKINRINGNKNDWSIYFNTLQAAGFKTVIPYISVLETDNLQAEKILNNKNWEIMQEVKNKQVVKRILRGRRKHSVISQLIKIYVQSLKKEFIFAKKGFETIKPEYVNPEVELFVLNQRRFYLSFSAFSDFSRKIDKLKINSITRPVLPGSDFQRVRLPY